jgi:hypothetical protein
MLERSEGERGEVAGFIRRDKANARRILRGHPLLKRADGWSIEQLAEL